MISLPTCFETLPLQGVKGECVADGVGQTKSKVSGP